MTRRWIAVVLATLLAMTGAVAGITAARQPAERTAVARTVAGPVVVIGAAGISWDDVSEAATPALWSLVRRGATGSVTVRSVELNTCPLDGWLSLSAGQRAGDVGAGGSADTAVTATAARPACRGLPDPRPAADTVPGAGPVSVPGWGGWVQVAAQRPSDARPGLLGQTLADHGVCVQAIGPGAAVAAADRSGRVGHYAPFPAGLPTPNPPPEALPLSTCPVTIVDVGAVRDPADVDPRDAERPTASRAAQVRRADQRVAAVLAAVPTRARVLVTGLADAGRSEHLRALALAGAGVPTGAIHSPSTRQDGLAQASDVTATVLAMAAVPVPDQVAGAPLQVDVPRAASPGTPLSATQGLDRLQSLRDLGRAAHEVHPLVGPFFVAWSLIQIAVYAAGAFAWRRAGADPAIRARIARRVAASATVAGAIPASTFLANLVPWWRATVPFIALVGAVAVFTAVISLLALAGPWRTRLLGPPAAVAAVTLAVLALDVMTGSRLQLSSLLGLQPVVGGRFYGMGNVTFALFGTAALLLAVCLASAQLSRDDRHLAGATVVAVGVAATLVDGWPAWGADFGGPPALVPAFGSLLLAVLGVRLTWRRAAGIAAVTAALLAALAVLDWRRPRDARTHLGSFVQSVLDGGAGEVIGRKLDQNVQILLSTPFTVAVPVVLAVIVYAVARPASRAGRRLETLYAVPLLRPGLVALLICYLIGFAVNDSGTAIPAVGATLAIPLLIAISVRSAASRDAELETAGSDARGPDAGLRAARRRGSGRAAARPRSAIRPTAPSADGNRG